MRELILDVVDGDFRGLPYAHQLYLHRRASEIFGWLVKNGITGATFYEFIQVQCKGSLLHAMAGIIARIDKEKEARPIFAKDLSLNP